MRKALDSTALRKALQEALHGALAKVIVTKGFSLLETSVMGQIKGDLASLAGIVARTFARSPILPVSLTRTAGLRTKSPFLTPLTEALIIGVLIEGG